MDNTDQISCMKYAGKVNQEAIEYGFLIAQPGVTLKTIDAEMEKFILDAGCKPAFKGYKPDGAPLPFPCTACISPNSVVVHGIPGSYVLAPGDLLTIDVGTQYNGWFVDSARTRIVDGFNPHGSKLIEATNAILAAQLAVIKHDCNFLTLVEAAAKVADAYNVKIIPGFGGHGIGNKIHLEPFVPNTLTYDRGHMFKCFEEQTYKTNTFIAGKTYCIEPVVTYNTINIYTDEDGWTVRTVDGSIVAHEERCILVLNNGIELLS